MKKIFFATLLVLFCFTNHSYAQLDWKERAEFYDVFNDIFLSAQVGNITPAIERKQELKEKFSPFFKSAMAKFTDPKDTRRRHLIVLSERMTYFNFLNADVDKIIEVWYGRLVLIHNKYRKILLDDEEPHISKSLLRHYEKEEDDFSKKEKKGLFNQNSGTTTKKETNNNEYLVKGFARMKGVGDGGLVIEIEAYVWYTSKKEDSGILGLKQWRKYIQKYEGIRFKYPNTSNRWFSFSGGETFGNCNISGTENSARCLVLGGMAFKLGEPTFY